MQNRDGQGGKNEGEDIHLADGQLSDMHHIHGEYRRQSVELGTDGGVEKVLQADRHPHGTDHEVQGRSPSAPQGRIGDSFVEEGENPRSPHGKEKGGEEGHLEVVNHQRPCDIGAQGDDGPMGKVGKIEDRKYQRVTDRHQGVYAPDGQAGNDRLNEHGYELIGGHEGFDVDELFILHLHLLDRSRLV